MSLKLGSLTTIVVSSPAAAKLVLQKHDAALSSRTVPSAAASHKHGVFSMAWAPAAGNQWRKLRKICREQMFSGPRLDAGQGTRREMVRKLSEYVKECSETGRAVNIGEAAFTTSLNMMSASLFSAEFARLGSDSSQEMKEVVSGAMRWVGTPNLGDYFPVLRSADPQGIWKETEFYFGKVFGIFDEIIDERLRSGGEKQDLVQALIDLNLRDEAQITREDIKHLLFDLFLGGVDTSSVTIEWAMTELIRNPLKMSRLKNELEIFLEENGQFQESDIPQLPYLQAVVKETLRLHPPGPFLIPHKAESEVEIHGYNVPKNAQILVNVWASGRDPGVWRNAEEFVPERFFNESVDIDLRGQDFELIPFGAGRRICPGLSLGYRMVHQMLTAFVANVEWKLENIKPEEIDMNEKFGLTLQKAISLTAVPMKK